MDYKTTPEFQAFRHECNRVFEPIALQLQSRLEEIEIGFFQIKKDSFCLRIYFALGHRSTIAISLIPTKFEDLPRWQINGGIGLGAIMSFYGIKLIKPQLTSRNMKSHLIMLLNLVRKFCLPIILNENDDWFHIQNMIQIKSLEAGKN